MRRLAIAGLVLAAMLAAQKKQKDTAESHAPRLVRVNVSVVDGSGSRPGDLTAEDFTVTDNGKPQKIVSFEKSGSKAGAPEKLGPHEFSNRTGAGLPHATLILFDLLNDRMGAKGYAWNQIIQTLQTLESNEYLYLYLLSSDAKFYPVHGLPDEEAISGTDDGSWTREIKPKLDAAMSKAARVRPIEMTDNNVRVITTLNALETVASRLAAIPGRKNLVWITRGIPISLSARRSDTGDIVDFSGPVQAFATAMERSRIAVYPVDLSPPGMDPGADASSGTAATAPVTGMGSADTLQQFADLTGGKAYLNQDVRGAIIQATGDARISYSLAYFPTQQAFDGKYHKIKVTCSRKGLKVNSKNGYYAYAEPSLTRNQQEAALDAAIESQFDASQIGLKAVMSPSAKFYSSVHLDISIDPAGATDPDGGQFLVTLADIHTDGRRGVSPTVPLDYKAGVGPVPFPQDRTVDAKVAKVRVIVMDSKTNAVGSLTIPITPADLSPAGK